MVEALDQPAAGEGLANHLGGRLSAQLLIRNAVGVGHIDDDLPLPAGQHLRDIRMRLEPDSQEDDVRLGGFRERFGSDPGSYRGRGGCNRSEEPTSEFQSLLRLSYAVICSNKTLSTHHHTQSSTHALHLIEHNTLLMT